MHPGPTPLPRRTTTRIVARELTFALAGILLMIVPFTAAIAFGIGILITWGNETVGVIVGLVGAGASLLFGLSLIPGEVRAALQNELHNPLRDYHARLRAVTEDRQQQPR